MKTYKVQLKNRPGSPMIMHADNVEAADRISAWRKSEAGKKGTRGDDRSPAWTWMSYTYSDGRALCLPVANIIRSLMPAGSQISTGQGKKTYKAQTQSSLRATQLFWPLQVRGKLIQVASFAKLGSEHDFEKHTQFAEENGFELHVIRATIGASKNVRVRPMFREWSVSGELVVTDDAITESLLQRFFDYAGLYVGLGDWRPSAPKPGPYGMFEAKVSQA